MTRTYPFDYFKYDPEPTKAELKAKLIVKLKELWEDHKFSELTLMLSAVEEALELAETKAYLEWKK